MSLKRELGVFGATMMGLGSILGTGVFVSIGIAAGIAGGGVVVAIVIAAAVATCNALNSAQLAANHPVSGGTYEYGYHYLNPWLGFAAGWMFLCAKAASAATAALGFAGYFVMTIRQDADWHTPVAISVVVVLTAVVLTGIRRSSYVNITIVTVTLVSLVAFVVAGVPSVQMERLRLAAEPLPLLHASALMFVAYTGYGRIATLGEEVQEPLTTIPRAIILTLVISALLYITVAAVGVGTAGAEEMVEATKQDAAPLAIIASRFALPVQPLVTIGAMTAMLGVLLNLLLGLSRVLLAMGRRGDMPNIFSQLPVAVLVCGIAIAMLAGFGSVKTTWSFSAFTVLIYYAVTNLAALRLGGAERLYSQWWARVGLLACLTLAFAVEWRIWFFGSAILVAGLAWHWLRRRIINSGTHRA